MAADFLVAWLDEAQELVREYGIELSGLSHLGDAPSVLGWLGLVVNATETTGWEVAGMELLRDLTMEIESLREVDERRRDCNSAIIWAPRAIEKEAREVGAIGLQGQELMRDVRDAFVPELVPEYVERAEALQERIAPLLAAPITF